MNSIEGHLLANSDRDKKECPKEKGAEEARDVGSSGPIVVGHDNGENKESGMRKNSWKTSGKGKKANEKKWRMM